jgi:hypothetical protein
MTCRPVACTYPERTDTAGKRSKAPVWPARLHRSPRTPLSTHDLIRVGTAGAPTQAGDGDRDRHPDRPRFCDHRLGFSWRASRLLTCWARIPQLLADPALKAALAHHHMDRDSRGLCRRSGNAGGDGTVGTKTHTLVRHFRHWRDQYSPMASRLRTAGDGRKAANPAHRAETAPVVQITPTRGCFARRPAAPPRSRRRFRIRRS